ncbi:MAG: hypothetical protein AMXMBFR67_23240 [Nitrospira sp.]
MEGHWRVRVPKVEGPASEGSVKVGDVILTIDQTEIVTPVELKSVIIEAAQPNQAVLVHVLWTNTQFHMTIVLGELASG